MKYPGRELDLFARALNWKRYWSGQMAAYLRGDVLEVGAGIGANLAMLWNERVTSLTCLEPDEDLAARITPPPGAEGHLAWSVRVGTTADLREGEAFDTILYADVIEHVPEDREELARAARFLRPGGHLIVLAPAHNFLATDFDRAIGHLRRYTRRTLAALGPESLRPVKVIYLDSVGILAMLGNRLLLGSSSPSEREILFWDRYLVPPSRVLDWLTCHRLGRSVLGVWRRPAD
jgi:SAM-dependent methyltransferase